MSVVIKTTEMQYRDANGVYHGINAVAEKKIADQEAALDQIIAGAQDAVNQLETQKNTIAQTVASMAQLGTDTTLSTPGMAADARACGDLWSTLVKLNDEYIKFGEVDMNACSSSLTNSESSATIRISKIPAVYNGNVVHKIYFKSNASTNIRFWIGEVIGDKIKLIKTFVISYSTSKSEYVNGIDFNIDTVIKENYVIGWQTPPSTTMGYYGGTTGSYKIENAGSFQEGDEVSYLTLSYGVGISADYKNPFAKTEYVDSKVDDAKNEIYEYIDNSNADEFNFGEPDISVCTSTPSNPPDYVARFSLPQSAYIGSIVKKINFKSNYTTSTPTRFFIGKLIEGNKVKIIDTFVVNTVSSKTEYVNGVDFASNTVIDKDYVIGWGYPAGTSVGYYGGTNKSLLISSSSGFDIGDEVSYSTLSYGVGISAVYESVDTVIERRLTVAETQIQSLISTGVVRYGAKINSGTNVFLDSDIIHVRVKYDSSSDSEVKLDRALSGTQVSTACRTDFVNFGTGKIGFYNAHAYGGNLSVYKEYTPEFSFVQGHEYDIFSIRYLGYIYQLTITDCWTQDTYTATELDGSPTIGSGWGARSVIAGEGVTIISNDNYTLQPKDNRITFIGDSYIEGNSIAEVKEKRYSALVFEKLKGDSFIWGQGGARSSDGISWLSAIMNLSDSEYYVLAFGMNDSDYSTWKTNMDSMIATVTAAGKVPILVTIPPVTLIYANEEHMLMNEYIRSLSYKYVDVAMLLSSGHDGETFDPDYFLSDGVHPTAASHKLIYDLFLSTIPEIFGTAIESN